MTVHDLRGASGVVLIIRFLTELALFAGLAVAGARLGGNVPLSVVNAILLPSVAIAVWARFVGPKAARRLPEPARFIVEFVLFAAAGVLLALTDWLIPGITVAATGIVIAALTRRYAKDG